MLLNCSGLSWNGNRFGRSCFWLSVTPGGCVGIFWPKTSFGASCWLSTPQRARLSQCRFEWWQKVSESFGFCHNSPSRMVGSMMDGERSALPMHWMNDDNCHGHSNNQLSLHTALTFFADNGVWVSLTSSFIEKKLAPLRQILRHTFDLV